MLETLEQWGCETEKTMERFLDEKCELDEGRITDAFVNAHGMKGTASNLGLVPIANILSKIVEPLRTGKTDGVMEQYDQLCVIWKKYATLCKNN